MTHGVRVYCHGRVVDAELRDEEWYCSCCGRPLPFVAEWFRRKGVASASKSEPRPTGLGRSNTVPGAVTT
jgi:hypothetical protein